MALSHCAAPPRPSDADADSRAPDTDADSRAPAAPAVEPGSAETGRRGDGQVSGEEPSGQARARPGAASGRPSAMRRSSLDVRSWAEWVTLAMSALIVLGIVALTTYFFLTAPASPAAVEVEPRLGETYQTGARFYLPIRVTNTGGATGEDVRVRVTLTAAGGQRETAEVLIPFLAGGGSTRAVVAFGSDPRQGQVEAAVVSYLEP